MSSEALQKYYTPECRLCPRECEVDREAGETGYCGVGGEAVVAGSHPHHGEEQPLSGTSGSGTIFFSGCNLRCDFCQNAEISQQNRGGKISVQKLARLMLKLEARGCHNVNLVTPTHSVVRIAEALELARDRGLGLPVVYNCGGYEKLAALEELAGLIDIYMPDFKFWSQQSSSKYMDAPDYPEVARRAVKEMHSQVGELKTDDRGLATSGLLIRHLVMPGHEAGSKKILDWIKDEISARTYVNVMGQYRPCLDARKHPEINRRPGRETVRRIKEQARKIGLERLD